MGTQAATAFSGNLKKAVAGLRRINMEGLRWRVFDAKGQFSAFRLTGNRKAHLPVKLKIFSLEVCAQLSTVVSFAHLCHQVLGRLASNISTVVQGKDKPTYAPNRDDGDMCIVINARDVCVTGRKLTDKVYYWHTGYVGHLKERTLKDQMAKDPTEVIRKAVMRMLPRNKLRDDRDRKLRIFAGSEHPFGDRPLVPYEMPPRTVREMRPRARRALIRARKKAEQQEQGGSDNRKGKRREYKTEASA